MPQAKDVLSAHKDNAAVIEGSCCRRASFPVPVPANYRTHEGAPLHISLMKGETKPPTRQIGPLYRAGASLTGSRLRRRSVDEAPLVVGGKRKWPGWALPCPTCGSVPGCVCRARGEPKYNAKQGSRASLTAFADFMIEARWAALAFNNEFWFGPELNRLISAPSSRLSARARAREIRGYHKARS